MAAKRLAGAVALACALQVFAQQSELQLALDDAAKAFEQGNVAEADQKVRSVLESHPSDLRALLLMGAVLDSLRRYGEADRYYQRALKLAPQSPQVLNNAANHYLASGNRSEARQLYLETLAADPQYPNANLQLARISLEDKQGHAALNYLSRLGTSATDDPGVLELRARALSLDGQCSAAGETAAKLESLAAGNWRAHFSAGAVYAGCKSYNQAEESFSRALDADPRNFDILYNLGLAALYAGHTERAAKVFEVALNERPDDVDCLYMLSRAYLQAQRTADAAMLLTKAARIAPGRAEPLLLLAQVSAQLGFYLDAVSTYDRYLRLRPGDETAHRERAFSLANTGDFKGALPDLEAYVRKHPHDRTGLYELATAQSFNDRKKAKESGVSTGPERSRTGLLDFLSLPPAEQRARYLANLRRNAAKDSIDFRWTIRLGTELLADGKSAEALEIFRQIRSASSDPQILARCGTALLEFEQYEAAREFLEAVVAVTPSFSAARLDLATAVFHLDGPHTALNELDKTAPEDRKGDYYLLRAQLLDSLGKVPEAADALNRGMQLAPTRASLYFQAASFLLKHQLRQEALSLLEQASRIVPDARELLLAECVALILVHRESDAEKLLAEIQARWPEWDRSYLLNGILLQMQLKPGEARRMLETAIALGAATPEAYYYQALSITESAPQDSESAEKAIDRALGLAPNDAYVFLLAGKIAVARKDYATGVQRLQRATQLQPGLIPAHYALRSAYKAIGDEQKSAAELAEIKRIGAENAAAKPSIASVEDFLFTVRAPR
jgi:tetratricopeptide (TPR) repeat protein